MEKLPRDFYRKPTLEVAKELIGCYLIHRIGKEELIGKIVETEAYIGGPFDKASHAYNYRRTERNEVMYGPPGFAYIYLIYGMYNCLNFVTAKKDQPEAILIRAVEPISGMEQMAQLRFQQSYSSLPPQKQKQLTNGPGKLCIAFQIDRSLNGADLCGNQLFVANKQTNPKIIKTKRINIDYAEEAIDFLWRFYEKANPYVSKHKNNVKE